LYTRARHGNYKVISRGDFQNWIRDLIGENELAKRIDDIKMCERHLAAEFCRTEILERVNVRLFQLEMNRLVSVRRKNTR